MHTDVELPIPRPRQPAPDPSTCGFCGHEWHGLECRDPFGPTLSSPLWPSMVGIPCRCPSAFLQQDEPCCALETPC